MHRACCYLLILGAVLSSGCSWLTRPSRLDIPKSPAVAAESACPSWRWIAVKSASEPDCPVPSASGWTAQPLFAVDLGAYDRDPTRQEDPKPHEPRQGQRDPDRVPPGLSSFCLYTHAAAGSQDQSRQVFRELIEARKLEHAAPDCAAIGTMAEPAASFEENLVAQAGGAGTEIPLAANPGAPPKVRLAFLDSQPTAGGLPTVVGNSHHGYALAHLARRLACPKGACLPRITTQLALPIVGFDPENPISTVRDEGKGGFFGTYGDLANAIRREVVAWESSGEQRLVLNLSLGWDGELFRDVPSVDGKPGHHRKRADETRGLGRKPDSGHAAPVLSVLRALQDAACRGALIVAATGNRTGGPQPGSGPLLPAAWETMDAPDAATCSKLLGSETAVRDAAGRQPLLYAAGGIRSEGFPLANSRPKAEPPRVAYADHAAVTDGAGQPTATYTGSSVASAVIATIAATVWHHGPSRTRADLMQDLHQSGNCLERKADFGHATAAKEVRRITLCRALKACAATGDGCPAPPDCPWWTRQPPSLTAWLGTITPDVTLDADQLISSRPPTTGCNATKLYHPPPAGAIPANPCPYDQFHDVTAHSWLSPQPEDPPCPTCMITRGSPTFKLYIAIDPQWQGIELHDATLNIGQTKIHLGLGSFKTGDTMFLVEIQNLDLHPSDKIALDPGSDVPIFVSFRIEHNGEQMSVQNPIFFAP